MRAGSQERYAIPWHTTRRQSANAKEFNAVCEILRAISGVSVQRRAAKQRRMRMEVRPSGLTAVVRLSSLTKTQPHHTTSRPAPTASLPQTSAFSAFFCGHSSRPPPSPSAPLHHLLLLVKLHPDPPAQQPAHAKHILRRPQCAAPEGVLAHAMDARAMIHRHLRDSKP
ncbi:hypothetical protein DES53_102240 [Roseimicrobium gellanilyticum]|uniref:Uncharacterized protein n=1 Tax=Roseimicrobium gellanilyticum TaxID=748857 RepID=A0A366HT35_9BACT|nr:hypothetical protein DES53_102240 [Roseimicrobium gellanilyticum]